MSGPPRPAPRVVVAAVVRRGGRYLVARRPAHKRHGGLWEFPGGKVRDGESPAEAARRELAEELDLEVTGAGECLMAVTDEASAFEILFVPVTVRGEPRALEHDELRWVGPAELAGMELAPADRRFAERLFEL